ncbi:uncharacterized protein B0H64DRAFT_458288 [Chaetomium fimeti]|uniref:Protein kinase domain-containing protein n=1 Tax=Chaetomium fimeti TaxID=1854472 RepID=A0AAE0HJQ3_9PEZI|nr:hypothetical protein B0H64DRAFT_458288 [Chaetomium fimeti]
MDQQDEVERLRSRIRDFERRQREFDDNIERERKRANKDHEQRLKAEQATKEAKEVAEKAKKAAEENHEQRLKAERIAEEAKRRLDLELRLTTLGEFLDLCQQWLHDTIWVETNKSLTSKGGLTNPADKWCPSRLMPWSDFLEGQKEILGEIHTVFGEERAFPRANEIPTLAKVVRRRLANEADVVAAQNIAIQYPVSAIISEAVKRPSVKAALGIISQLVFENHGKANQKDKGKTNQKDQTGKSKAKTRPDQVAVFSPDVDDPDNLEGRAIAFVVEYKAPHKLTARHLRLGLREMDIRTEVVNRQTVPRATQADDHLKYVSDRLVAAAITQTYHYMIENGLEYSYLTTTEAFVFLKIDWDNPGDLFFHLAEPKAEVAEHGPNGRSCTAVSQVLAFALLALKTRQRSQAVRKNATEGLQTWAMDWELMERLISQEQDKDAVKSRTPSASGLTPPTPKNDPGVDRSPQVESEADNGTSAGVVALEQRRCQTEAGEGTGGRTSDKDDDHDDDNRGATDESTNTLRPQTRSQTQRSKKAPADANKGPSSRPQKRSYCTQQCLLGLVCGFTLDSRCPNVALHRRGNLSDRCHHPVDHETWQRLVAEQLDRTLDEGIKPLWKQGARGVLFSVTLLEYGYTFVAKATTTESIPHLKREAKMYRQLRTLQGSGIPVFLGAVDLKWPYRYNVSIQLIHMIFLSWGGESILAKKDELGLDQAALDRQLLPLVQNMHRLGVVHMDVRGPNILWCDEIGRIMLIDFERAITVASCRKKPHPLRAQAVQRFIQEDLCYAQIALRAP